MAGPGTTAKSAAGTATSTAAGYGAEAGDIGSLLVPKLEQEALHPTGFDPNDMNAMLVGGEQGAGGANASVAGEAGLRAARTRNTGALSSVLDEASRNRGRQLSENVLDVQGKNALLKQKQQQKGLSGLESVRGGDIKANLEAQGLVPQDIKQWADWANNSGSVFGDILGTINSLAGAGKAAFPKGLQG